MVDPRRRGRTGSNRLRRDLSLPGSGRPLIVVAHRGASGEAPENTRAAIKLAVAQGADYVEMDIQRSADGALVLMHDRSVADTTNALNHFPGRPSYLVSDFSLSELKELDAGAWFASDFAGEPVLTLHEAVAELGEKTGVFLEVKYPKRYPGIEEDIARATEQSGVEALIAADRLVVASIDRSWTRKFHALRPDVRMGVLAFRPGSVKDSDLREIAEYADVLGTGERYLPRSFVDRAHGLGIGEVYLTTDCMQDHVRAARSGNCDGILTNFPRRLRGVLGGQEWIITGESMLDPGVAASAPIVVERTRTGGRRVLLTQLVFAGRGVGERATMAFDVPQSGLYKVSVSLGRGPYHGAHSLEIDGRRLGDSFDGYLPRAEVRELDCGAISLSEGQHDLSLAVTGKNPASSGFVVSLRHLKLERLGPPMPASNGRRRTLVRIERAETPYYKVGIVVSPQVYVHSLAVDPSGRSRYRPVLEAVDASETPSGTRPFLACARRQLPSVPGAASSVEWSTDDRRLVLRGMLIQPFDVTVDWSFTFAEQHIDHQITWNVAKTVDDVQQLGWKISTNLYRFSMPGNLDGPADVVQPFPQWIIASDHGYLSAYDLTLAVAYRERSALGEDAVQLTTSGFATPSVYSMAWRSIDDEQGRVLLAGRHHGGIWRIGASPRPCDDQYADVLHARLNR